jgi:hypothetical protein
MGGGVGHFKTPKKKPNFGEDTHVTLNPKPWRSSMQNIFLMFCLGCGWTPRDELYGIIDQLIDPGLGLHEPIGILELSTFDSKVCMIPIVHNTNYFFGTRRHKFLHVLVNCS